MKKSDPDRGPLMNRLGLVLLASTMMTGVAVAQSPLDAYGRSIPVAPLPPGVSEVRPATDRVRDRLSIRDFLPPPACNGIADDSPTVYAATAAMAGTGREINVPGDCRLNMGPAARLAGNRIVLDGTGLVGEIGRDSGISGPVVGSYGQRGGTILLTDTGGPAFIVKRDWTLRRLAFFWPGETEAAAVANGGTPVAMPALITGAATAGLPASEATEGEFADNDVVNAWDVMDFTADVSGGLRVHDNRAFVLDNFLRLGLMPVETYIHGNQFTPNAFFNQYGVGVGPTFNLRNYAGVNASVVQAMGTATVGQYHADGLKFTDNYTFGLGYGFRATGGQLNLLNVVASDFDGVPQVMHLEASGSCTGCVVTGGQITSYAYGTPTSGTALTAVPASPNLNSKTNGVSSVISADANSATGSSLTVNGVMVVSATGPFVDWRAPGSDLALSFKSTGLNNSTVVGQQLPGVHVDALGGKFRMSGSDVVLQGATPGYGVEITNPLQLLSLVDDHFVNTQAPIDHEGGYPSAQIVIAGDSSVGTHGALAFAGTIAGNLSGVINDSFDVPVPGWSILPLRGADGATVFSYGSQTQMALLPNGGGLRLRGTLTQSVTP